MLKLLSSIAKRGFDILFSITILLLLSPLLFVIAIAIIFNDRGPVFYKAQRVGLNGKVFRMFKFRTMIVNADKIGASTATTSDVRITSVGHFLRRAKLDELPQFLNVLAGQMSVVGPRPEVKTFTDMFTEEEKAILTVKPGITDWASIRFSNEGEIVEGSSDPDATYKELIWPEKKRLQIKYVKEHSFLIDIKIIWLTLIRVFIK